MRWIARAFSIPRDGGVLLASGAVLSALSALTGIDRLRVGPAAYPAWVPIALDGVIAIVAGAILAFGGRLLEDLPATPGPDFVVVRKSVWEDVQADVVAVRRLMSHRELEATPPPPPPPPAPVNPWDEGPPTSVPAAAETSPPLSVLPKIGPETGGPAVDRGTSPAAKPSAVPRAVPPRPKLSSEELEEIARLGGILGFVPAAAQADSERAPATVAAPKPAPAPRPERPAPLERSQELKEEAESGPEKVPDIDELMNWLDRIEADKISPPPGEAAKKKGEDPDEKGKAKS